MGDTDFTCTSCGFSYPTIARTKHGTCIACGNKKKQQGSRKSLFVQREKYNKFTLESLNRHKQSLKKPVDFSSE